MYPDSPYMKIAKDRFFEYSECFEIIHEGHLGFVRKHRSVDENDGDYALLKQIAIEKSQHGGTVDIMPILHPKDKHRGLIFPDAKPNKCPDLRINGTLFEVKKATKPRNANNLKHAIDAASNQADHVIINVEEPLFIAYVYRVCNSRFLDHEELKLIEVRYGNYWISAERSKVISLYESMK